MKRFIFGFQRRVWWPKCTPASNSCFILTTATAAPPSVPVDRSRERRSDVPSAPPWDPRAAGVCACEPGILPGIAAIVAVDPDVHGGRIVPLLIGEGREMDAGRQVARAEQLHRIDIGLADPQAGVQ